jgi:hypothetical protein
MKINDGRKKLEGFIKQAEKDGDPYLIVHFSREEDRFKGIQDGLDFGDALIIVNQLIKEFDIQPEALTA